MRVLALVWKLSSKRKILFIFGTRPEAIKLCPVILHLRRHLTEFDTRVCVTAQHRGLLDQVLAAFAVEPDHDLDVMLPGQTLFQSTSRILAALEAVLLAEQPEMIFVQGDTTTTFCGALAGFYRGVPVAHVEAGLRTWDMRQPFPEEMNRVLTTRLTALHLPPTEGSAENLRRDGVADSHIFVTGNTCIDALLAIKDKIEGGGVAVPAWEFLDASKKMIWGTGHRREGPVPGVGRGGRRRRGLRRMASALGRARRGPREPHEPGRRGVVVLACVDEREGLAGRRSVRPWRIPRRVGG